MCSLMAAFAASSWAASNCPEATDAEPGWSVDEETGESTESKCDVVLVELAKPGLAEQTAKNTSDIEYIAIMSDIEL